MKVLWVGDMVAGKTPPEKPYDETLLRLFSGFDYRIVNFEAPVKTSASPAPKVGPVIAQSIGWERVVAPFNVASLANNHIMDYGTEGLKATMDALEKTGILTCGAGLDAQQAYRPLILEKDEKKLALIAAGEAQFGCLVEDDAPGYAWIFHPGTLENISRCKEEGCRVVVMPHAGLEMHALPLPEWRRAYKSLIAAGADAVVASHPHIVQAREPVDGKPIYYSLGNFYFPMPQAHPDPGWYFSMGVVMIWDDDEPKFEHVFFRFDENGVRKADGDSLFDALCDELHAPDYPEKINRLCLKAWDDIYQRMYMFHPIAKRHNPFRILDRWFNAAVYLFKGNDWFDRVNEMRLYHNIRIETHRYVVERALALKNNLYR
jgi:poly-gamma-glutamate synthesis protein (capsule biosynthesis protein)